jgi:MFS family permease
MSTGPAWNTWAQTLVPRRIAARYFARRARLAQAALLVGLLGAGLVLEQAREAERLFEGFALIFLLAGIARAASAWMLASQSEPVRMPADFRILGWRGFAAARAGSDYRRLVALMLGLQISVYVSAPYFNPYMLGELRLRYDEYVTLVAAVLVAKAVFSPFVAEIAERVGSARVLRASVLGLVPLPALWMVSDNFGYLLGIQIFAGLAWGAYELITLLLFFETIPASERTSVLTLFNLASAIAIVVGTAAGAFVLAGVGVSRDGYYALFAISALARMAVVFALPRVRVPRFRPAPLATRSLAVGATSGSMDRPVLPSIERMEE